MNLPRLRYLVLIVVTFTIYAQAERPHVVWMRSGINNGILDMEHSPDGQFLATTELQQLKLWRLSDGMLARTYPLPCAVAGNAYRDLLFSPDGQYVLFSCREGSPTTGTIRRLRLSDGAVDNTFASTAGSIEDFAFMPDGSVGVGVAEPFNPPPGSVRFFAYPGGTQIGSTLTQVMYTNAVGQPESRPIMGGSRFSAIGRILVGVGGNTSAVINPNGSLIGFSNEGQGFGLITPDGTLVAGTSQVYRVANLCRPNLQPPCGGVAYSVAGITQFSPDSQTAAAVTTNPNLLNFHSTTNGSLIRSVPTGNFFRLDFSPDSASIVIREVAGNNFANSLRRIPLSGGAGTRLETFYRDIQQVLYSPDEQKIVVISPGSPDSTASGLENIIRILNPVDGSTIHTIFTGLTGAACGGSGLKCAHLSANGDFLYYSLPDGNIHVYRMSDYQLDRTISIGALNGFDVSPDGNKIARRVTSGSTSIHNAATGAEDLSIPFFGSLAFTNDSNSIFIGSGSVRLHNATTGALIRSYNTTGLTVNAIDASPDGNKVAFAGIGSAEVWNVSGSFDKEFSVASSGDQDVKFTPSGGYLFTAGVGPIRVWRIGDGNLMATYDQEVPSSANPVVSSVDFSPDGTKFVYGRNDATVVTATNPYVSPSLQLSNSAYSVAETGTSATITVTRLASSVGAVSVDYSTSNGSATAGQDYTAASGTLSWADGDGASKTFTIPISDDNIFEGNETINITLSNPTGGAALGSPASAVLTINENEVQPVLSISNVTADEGNSGPNGFQFTVTLSGPSAQTVTANYATANGTAAAPLDYSAIGSTLLTFSPGETSKQFFVFVNGDYLVEPNEAFLVNLSGATNATVQSGQGTGTITNDDFGGLIQFSLANYSADEATGARTITVERTGGLAGGVTVNYASSNGTAIAGQDYTAASGTLTFDGGQTFKTFNVVVLDDTTDESDETINLTLTNPAGGGSLGTPSSSVLTVVDDDSPPGFSISDVSRAEGNSGTTSFTFTVLKSGQTELPVAVGYSTADGTASSPGDYALVGPTTLTFSPAETSKQVTILVNGDQSIEGRETFFVNLTDPTNAVLNDAQGVGTILNDDFATFFDYDGDRIADLSVFRAVEGSWYLRRTQAGYFATLYGFSTDKIVPADYDGDGLTDMAVFRPANGTWYLMNSSNQTFQTFSWGASGDLPVPADHDGDGKADLVVFRQSNGTWYRRLSNNTLSNVVFGTVGDKPVVGDFDGDGKFDIALYRPSDHNWYILKTDFGFFVQTWGEPADIPVPADYDGDGQTDVSVWRPSTGQWFRIQSTAGFGVLNWGQTDDMPVPADYDGDGKADVAVFRPSTGTWFAIGSTSGIIQQQFGQSGDLPTQSAFVY